MKYDELFIKEPFSPVSVTSDKTRATVDVWGRRYQMDQRSPLFSSILSQGEEVLAGPIRIVMEENGAPSEWSDTRFFVMDSDDPTSQTICATMSSEVFYINTTSTVEFDGLTRIQLRLMAKGLTVAQGMLGKDREKIKSLRYVVDKLWVEIPVKRSSALCYQIFPQCAVKNEQGEIIKPQTKLSTGDSIHNGTACFPFLAQFFVTGEKTGLGVVSESDRFWQPVTPDRAIECVNVDDDTVIIRLRLLDSQPQSWRIFEGGGKVRIGCPITFDFGIQVTPVKSFPKNPYAERNVHIDCFKKLDNDYEEYLSAPFVKDNGDETGEIGFDRLKRLGVNTLYLHEKWNDLQNSPLLTKNSANRLRYIVDECHKRDIKVIPYFGYEISSLSPEWGERLEEIHITRPDGLERSMWNREPYQRCVNVCCNSSMSDSLPRGIAALMDRFGFDGVYLDGTLRPLPCSNQKHGCGYVDFDGVLHPTYPIWGSRKYIAELYKVVHERGGTINFHTAGSYNLAALSMCDSIWEGEVTQMAMFHMDVNEMPEGIYRGQFDGRIFGLPLFMLAYTHAPKWTHEHSTAFALLLGTLHKPNDMDEPLESTSALWSLLDEFSIEEAEWHPYWQKDSLVVSNHKNVKVSYYKNGNKLLVFAANTVRDFAENVILSANGIFYGKINADVVGEGATVPDNIENFGYRVYFVVLK